MGKAIIATGIILALFCLATFAIEEKPKNICFYCDEEIIRGDVLAPVQGEKELYYIHFRCALKKHLRTYKK